jgi:DNA-binding beta-propeller fold protein YncE
MEKQPMRHPILRTAIAAALTLLLASCTDTTIVAESPTQAAAPGSGGFEVWIVDQSGTQPGNPSGPGGTLHIFDGAKLMGSGAASAQPIQRIDLGEMTRDVCASTGKVPVRPHMILFNREHTHGILSFVASGHVVIIDAGSRTPLACFLTSQSGTGQQAHAAFPAPDGSYIVVANQSGKRLERIDTDFRTNTFVHNPAATLDLATCVTPSGAPCEAPGARLLNWPICPIIDENSQYTFVTLRGGGLFVVDARQTPMRIVAEYDVSAVKGNGCGGAQVGGHMYINSGGSPVNVSGSDPHHPALYGFDVYRFPLSGYWAERGPNRPAPELLFSKSGMSDSHGMAPAGDGRFLWVMDRHADVAEVLDVDSGTRVNTIALNGALTPNAAPDLVDAAPSGQRLFVALRGRTPLSGDPHNATGATPGLGIIRVTDGGRSGELMAVLPLENPVNPGAADPHGIRVRMKK